MTLPDQHCEGVTSESCTCQLLKLRCLSVRPSLTHSRLTCWGAYFCLNVACETHASSWESSNLLERILHSQVQLNKWDINVVWLEFEILVISSENVLFIKWLCSTYADQINGILALEFSKLITSWSYLKCWTWISGVQMIMIWDVVSWVGWLYLWFTCRVQLCSNPSQVLLDPSSRKAYDDFKEGRGTSSSLFGWILKWQNSIG